MKVWELVAWLESNADPEDDVVLMDLPDPDNPPDSLKRCPHCLSHLWGSVDAVQCKYTGYYVHPECVAP